MVKKLSKLNSDNMKHFVWKSILVYSFWLFSALIPAYAQNMQINGLLSELGNLYKQDGESLKSGNLARSAKNSNQISLILTMAHDTLLPLNEKLKTAIEIQSENLQFWEDENLSTRLKWEKQSRISMLTELSIGDLQGAIRNQLKPEVLSAIKQDLTNAMVSTRKSENILTDASADLSDTIHPEDTKHYLKEALKKLSDNQDQENSDSDKQQQDQNQSSNQPQDQNKSQSQQQKEKQQQEQQKQQRAENEAKSEQQKKVDAIQKQRETYEMLKKEMIEKNLDLLNLKNKEKQLSSPRVQVEKDW